jgi:hypothetical protein
MFFMTIAEKGLAEAQCQQLHERGYVAVPGVIDDVTIGAVRDELHGVVDSHARNMHAEGLIPSAFSDAGFDRQLAEIEEQDASLGLELIKRVYGDKGEGGHMGPAIFKLLSHPSLLDAIESLVGPEIIGSSVYRIRPKSPGFERGAVPWHQDSGYLRGHCDKELIITCWIPLVDADVENGCLYVIPGAHRRGILEHHTGGPASYLVIQDSDLPDDLEAIPVPVPRGGVLFMTNLTPHSSRENRSNQVRWSIDLRYQDASVPDNVDKLPGDIDPQGPEVEIACYPAEADFVLRSPSNPNKEIREWQQLKALRDEYFEHLPELRRFTGRWAPVSTA